MTRRSKRALEDLHDKLARKLEALLDAIPEDDSKGAAAILNVTRQFLKDNGIDAVPTEGSALGNLAAKATEFPFDPAEDSATH